MSNKSLVGFIAILCFGGVFYLSMPVQAGAYPIDEMCRNGSSELLVKYTNEGEPRVLSCADRIELAGVASNPLVEIVEPNFAYRTAIIKYDYYYKNQWYLQKIKSPESWDIINESPAVIIAVIDSGVDLDHPDLADNIWTNAGEIPGNGIDDDNNGYIDDVHGYDFVGNSGDPSPKFEGNYNEDGISHGTIIAGIAAASGGNGEGIFGVTWKAQVMALKALDDSGEGSTSNVIRALNYARENGANIVNFSFVGPGKSQNLENAIRQAYKSGLIMVAAAGNEQENGEGFNLDDNPMYPVCYDSGDGENWVIGVAATDAIDQKTGFSSYGFGCIDITAPGVSVFSTVPYYPQQKIGNKIFNIYYDGYWSGTSVAAPMVSAALALSWQAAPFLDNNATADTVLTAADNIYRVNPNYLGQLGRGRLNIYNAVKLADAKTKNFKNYYVAAPFSGGISEVKIASFEDVASTTGAFLAYNENFNGGARLAAAVWSDFSPALITGAGPGGGPHIRIFSLDGSLLGQFFAYDKNFRGGVSVAAGDINGDGQDEIITGAGPGGGPQVRIFDDHGDLQGQFFAYAENFRGGVNVGSGDVAILRSGMRDEIITAPWSKGQPHIRIFGHKFEVIDQWYAYEKRFTGGVALSIGDLDNDGAEEIVTAAGPGGSPHVRVFDLEGRLANSFLALNKDFLGGVTLAIMRKAIEPQPFK